MRGHRGSATDRGTSHRKLIKLGRASVETKEIAFNPDSDGVPTGLPDPFPFFYSKTP
jgi:hypothetical protein